MAHCIQYIGAGTQEYAVRSSMSIDLYIYPSTGVALIALCSCGVSFVCSSPSMDTGSVPICVGNYCLISTINSEHLSVWLVASYIYRSRVNVIALDLPQRCCCHRANYEPVVCAVLITANGLLADTRGQPEKKGLWAEKKGSRLWVVMGCGTQLF